MANIALILAGGTGSRLGSTMPKQFLQLANNKEIIVMSIDVFAKHPQIDRILVVCHKDYLNLLGSLIEMEHYKTPISLIAGGDTRQESSFLGLCKLEKRCNDDDIILIHDAARPFVTSQIISDNITCAIKTSACTTVISMQDTVLFSQDDTTATSIPDRSKMYRVQTPQTFRLQLILNAHRTAQSSVLFTDDAGLLVTQNIPVTLVAGDNRNIKITSSEDMSIANSFLK